MHPLDSALQFTQSDNRFHGNTSQEYANMIGPYGGITAAAMLKAMTTHSDRIGEPISLTVNYAAAVKDGSYEIEPTPTRTGRSTQHWSAVMRQNGNLEAVTTATAIFATRKETWRSTELPFPDFPPGIPVFAPDFMPPWSKKYRFRFARGFDKMMQADSPSSETLQAIRDEPPRPLDFLSLTAICDVFAPRVFVRRPRFVPVGTVSLTIYFHANTDMLNAIGTSEVIGHARGNRFYDRYFDQSAEVWSMDGDLLATTTQLVYFKE